MESAPNIQPHLYPGSPALFHLMVWGGSIYSLLALIFTVWMIVDCVRSGREYYWIWLMLVFWGFGAVIYFFVNVWSGTAVSRGLMQGHHRKQRIRDLQAKIHHIDNAYHYTELGDAHLEGREWDEARKAYEAALERDPKSFDASVHLGYALLGLGRHAEAWSRFEPALAEKADYEYGELMWKAARCRMALGDAAAARELYRRLVARHNYAEAQLEYAEVLEKIGEREEAGTILKAIVMDAGHAPKFQQRRDRGFIRQARKRLAAQGIKV